MKTAMNLEHIAVKKADDRVIEMKAQKKDQITILVVDDDSLIIDLLNEYLAGYGYDIIKAGSGEEALLKIKSMRIDLALVDLKMPGMDGLETVEHIAEIDHDLVTILMTGYPTLDSSVKAMRLGASDYILKPFKLQEVSLAVKNAIKQRGLRREVKSLRARVSELEKSMSDRKDSIKINKKLDVIAASNGHTEKPLF